MPSKSLLPRGFKAEAERLAVHYREKLGLSKFAPLNAYKLAEHLNVEILSVDEVFERQMDNVAYSKMSDTQRFSAMWTPSPTGEKRIIHNTNHSEYRQQSNLMHELSHIVRNHTVPDDIAKLCARFGLHYFNKQQEQEAKYLGGCFQITRAGLQWAYKNNFSEAQISNYFNASIDMVKYRLGVTGVRKQNSYTQYGY